jgi:hypothetical protein
VSCDCIEHNVWGWEWRNNGINGLQSVGLQTSGSGFGRGSEFAYYAVLMGGVPRKWKERFVKKGEAIYESWKGVLNETLGVSW